MSAIEDAARIIAKGTWEAQQEKERSKMIPGYYDNGPWVTGFDRMGKHAARLIEQAMPIAQALQRAGLLSVDPPVDLESSGSIFDIIHAVLHRYEVMDQTDDPYAFRYYLAGSLAKDLASYSQFSSKFRSQSEVLASGLAQSGILNLKHLQNPYEQMADEMMNDITKSMTQASA